MKIRLSTVVQMNALHDKILEEYPNLAGKLGVGGTDGETVEFWGDDETLSALTARLDCIPALELQLEPPLLTAGTGQQARISARSTLADGAISLLVWADGARDQAQSADMMIRDGQGELAILAETAGRLVVDCIDPRCLARVRLDVVNGEQEVLL
jgi:hypothetical protein